MIRPEQIDVGRLLGLLLKTDEHSAAPWRARAEIIQDRDEGGREVWRVRCATWYLRYSKGPLQHHFWDGYGDDYHAPELAVLALAQADPPPTFLTWYKFDSDKSED